MLPGPAVSNAAPCCPRCRISSTFTASLFFLFGFFPLNKLNQSAALKLDATDGGRRRTTAAAAALRRFGGELLDANDVN